MNAGLTNLQARVYLAILELGRSDVTKISKFTSIDKSNIYKTIKDLEKFQLIEKYLGTSNIYKPVPFQIARLILSERKKQEYINAVQDLEKLTIDLDIISNYQDKDEEFIKIIPSGTQAFSRNWERALKSIKSCIDLIVTEKREIKDDPIWIIYDELIQRGIKVRWIFDRSEKNDQEFILRIKQFEQLLKYPDLKIKACFDCLRPFGGILDNKIAVIFLDKGTHLKCVRSLWTNNSEIVLNFKEHFDVCWQKSVSCPVKMILN